VVTFNRPTECKELLLSLKRQTLIPYEIIVIDDCSSIPFKPKVELKNIRILRTKRELGLGKCRKIGSILAMGDVVAFIDDDAIATIDWLRNIAISMERGIDIVGGPCKPIYKYTVPHWWDSRILGKYLALDNNFIVGCNFAVKRKVLEDLGFFKTYLGRFKNLKISNEEVDLIIRAYRYGYKIFFDENVKVCHIVHREKLCVGYLLKRAYYQGISMYFTVGNDLKTILLERRLRKKRQTQKSSI
ncbi:MAG: glycosyltransferase family A protein, partial [Nitrososphaeria archaeon]